MLSMLCLTLIGNYYAYDGPTATQTQLSDHFYPGGNSTSTDDDGGGTDPSSFQFRYNLLYSVYSWPNIVLPFFGGYLCDKLGKRLMLIVFLLFITSGQAVFAMGASLDPGNTAWYTMWLGRTIFGFGGESLCVAQSALIASWFAGKELAFALGLNLALGRIGSVINDAVSVQIATNFPVYYAFWAALGVCCASLVSGLCAYHVDKAADERLRANKQQRPKKETPLLLALLCAPLWAQACAGGSSNTNNNGKGKGDDAMEALVTAALRDDEEGYEEKGIEYVPEAPTEVIEMSAVLRFPLTFWLLALSCVCTYACVLCFNNFASGFIMQKWLAKGRPIGDISVDEESAMSVTANTIVRTRTRRRAKRALCANLQARILCAYRVAWHTPAHTAPPSSLPQMLTTYLVAGMFAPFMGALIDYVGFRGVFNCFAATMIVGVHLCLAYTDIYPVAPLVILGLCYSIYASALWPSIALVTEPAYHATAYGVVTAVQNLGLASVPLGVGLLMPSPGCHPYSACVDSYQKAETLLIGFGLVGVLSSIALNIADYRCEVPVLNWSEAKVQAFKKERAARGAGINMN